MLEVSITDAGFTRMEQALLKLADKQIKTAAAKALTRLATGARKEVMGKLDSIFDRPTPFTQRAIRYDPATRDNLTACVFISDDATRGLSPRKYLAAEIEGGGRRDKRSERSMLARGVMSSGQQWTASRSAKLDAFGNVPGSAMVQMMSRVGGFRETGYKANATAATRKRLVKQGATVTKNGFEFFIKRGKGGKPLGIYKITAPGVKATPGVKGSSVRARIEPELIFINKHASYRPRFPFPKLVHDYARRMFPAEMMRAVQQEIARQ